jgi:hypothetical protein
MKTLGVTVGTILALGLFLASVPARGAGVFGEEDDTYRCGDDVCARTERCCLAQGDGGVCNPECTRGLCPPAPCDVPAP